MAGLSIPLSRWFYQGVVAPNAEVKVEAQSTLDLKASGPLKIKGATVDIN